MASLRDLANEAVETTRKWLQQGRELGVVLFCVSFDDKRFLLEPRDILEENLMAMVGEALEHFSVQQYIFCAKMTGFRGNLPAGESLHIASEKEVREQLANVEAGTFVMFFGEDVTGAEVCWLYNEDVSEQLLDGADSTNMQRFLSPKRGMLH